MLPPLPPLPPLAPLPPLPALPPIGEQAPTYDVRVVEALEEKRDTTGNAATERELFEKHLWVGAAPLPPLTTLPLPFEPEAQPLKLTPWFPLSTNPVHAGNYELASDAAPAFPLLGRYLWDGREWADRLPPTASSWRGVDRGRWVNTQDAQPAQSGWYRMRWPRGEAVAQSYYSTASNDHCIDMPVGWWYADTDGELLPYKHTGPKWQAEWWHDGAPE